MRMARYLIYRKRICIALVLFWLPFGLVHIFDKLQLCLICFLMVYHEFLVFGEYRLPEGQRDWRREQCAEDENFTSTKGRPYRHEDWSSEKTDTFRKKMFYTILQTWIAKKRHDNGSEAVGARLGTKKMERSVGC